MKHHMSFTPVGVRNLNATHGKYLFRSLLTKKFLGLVPRNFFIQSEGLVCNHDAVVYVIAAGVWHHAPACIFLRIDSIHHFVMIPFAPSSRFHTATSCGFHTRLWRDLARVPTPISCKRLAILTILCYTKHRKAVAI